MVLRHLVNGLRKLDWFTVFVEIVIVVFGVYLGILLGNIQAQADLDNRVNQTLAAIKSDLLDDLARLDQVIKFQNQNRKYQQGAMASLSTTPINTELFDVNLVGFEDGNDTFYPNFATYSTLKDEGYMPEIDDADLRLALGRLYEREFGRALDNARIYDDMRQTIFQNNIVHNYDYLTNTFLKSKSDAASIVRNGIYDLTGQTTYYLNLLTDNVRPQMLVVIDAIENYLTRMDMD